MMVYDAFRFAIAWEVLNNDVSTFDRTHTENGPKESLQARWEINERTHLLYLYVTSIDLYHVVVILIQLTQT